MSHCWRPAKTALVHQKTPTFLDLGPMYATDTQTSDTHHNTPTSRRLTPPEKLKLTENTTTFKKLLRKYITQCVD